MPTELEQRAREILRSVYTQHENYAIGAPMLAMSDSAHSDRIVIAAIAAALQAQQPNTLCEDCPPVGYPTDTTRCDPCPRKAQQPGAQAAGWIVIPAEPTEEMMESGEKVYLEMNIADPLMHVWDAMMAVRPKPPGAQAVAWKIPRIVTFANAQRTNCPPDMQAELEGSVGWELSMFGDSAPVTDKHGLVHRPIPLYTHPQPPSIPEPSAECWRRAFDELIERESCVEYPIFDSEWASIEQRAIELARERLK